MLMTLAGVALGLVFVILLTRELPEHHFKGSSLAEAVLLGVVGTLISNGFVWLGWRGVVAGVRGREADPSPVAQRCFLEG